jgi:hypothetical protein
METMMILIVARCGFQEEKEKEKKRGRTKEPVVWKEGDWIEKRQSRLACGTPLNGGLDLKCFERQTCDPVDERCGMFPKFSLEPRAT